MKLILLRILSLFESVYLTYILKRGLCENVKKTNSKEEFTVLNTFLKILNFCCLVFTYRRIFEI